MDFGIYVHHAGATWFDQAARTLTSCVRPSLLGGMSTEVDGLFFGFRATQPTPSGQTKIKRKVRRDYTMKDAAGSRHLFRCLVEIDADVSDADLVAHASSEGELFEFTKALLLRCLAEALSEFEHEQEIVRVAVSQAVLPHEPRW